MIEQFEAALAQFGLRAALRPLPDTGPRFYVYEVLPQGATTVAALRARQADLSVRLGLQSVVFVQENGKLYVMLAKQQAAFPRIFDIIRALPEPMAPGEFVVGVATNGRIVRAQLRDMPHLLVCGATGSGKSVALHSLICGLAATHASNELNFLLIDPKRIELPPYAKLPHLLAEPACGPLDAGAALDMAINAMEARYSGSDASSPIVVIIDEFADLFTAAPSTEAKVRRLAAKARAANIHIVLATQRASVRIVSGDTKANFPSRLALRTASAVDSRVMLERPDASTLLGKGDAIFRLNGNEDVRIQVPYCDMKEIMELLEHYR